MDTVCLKGVLTGFIIREVIMNLNFSNLILEIHLKISSEVQISAISNGFIDNLRFSLYPNIQKNFILNSLVERMLRINDQNHIYFPELVHGMQEKVINLVFSDLKGNFFGDVVLILKLLQFLVLGPEPGRMFYLKIVRKFAVFFFSQGVWFSCFILFTNTEKTKSYPNFDLSYSLEGYLKEHTIIICYQSFFDRLDLSLKSLNMKIQTQINNFQRKTVGRSIYKPYLIGISTFVTISTEVKHPAIFGESCLKKFLTNNLVTIESYNNRFIGIIRFEGEFSLDEKSLIRNNLLSNNGTLSHLKIVDMKSYFVVSRKLFLKGGMDRDFEPDNQVEFYGFQNADYGIFNGVDPLNEDSWFDVNDAELFVIEEITNRTDLQHFEMNINEDVTRYYAEEMARLSREDQRQEEDILRKNSLAVAKANIQTIINNIGVLAQTATEIATSEIIWDRNQPFDVLKNIFTLIIDG
jgi:hypothetical protein